MSLATRFLLIRHMQPAVHVRGRVCGRLDVSLSARGARGARQLARTLDSIQLEALYTSPAQRALETADPLAEQHEITPTIDADLHEIDFGHFEGRTYDEIARRHPDLYHHWMEHPTLIHFPGGESYDDLRRRTLSASERIRAAYPGRTVAIVTHAGVIRTLIAHSLAMPPDALFRIDQAYGALTVIDWVENEPLVRLINGQAAMVARRRRGFLPALASAAAPREPATNPGSPKDRSSSRPAGAS
jgi:alpha-ribazole phosphatase